MTAFPDNTVRNRKVMPRASKGGLEEELLRIVVGEAVAVRRLAQDVQLCASVLKSLKTVKANLRLYFTFIRQENTHKGGGIGVFVSHAQAVDYICDNRLTSSNNLHVPKPDT